jgi:hypothetical protein
MKKNIENFLFTREKMIPSLPLNPKKAEVEEPTSCSTLK